jgi:hypothetical protein
VGPRHDGDAGALGAGGEAVAVSALPDTPRTLFDDVPEKVLQLARTVSLAARIEPELIRRIRLELHPGLDVSVEADLWFSRLAAARSTRFLVLDADAANALRLELADEPETLSKAWQIVRVMHAAAPPILQIEEEITYLALTRDPAADEAISRLLAGIVHAITVGDRAGLLDWAVRALPALPERAMASQNAMALSMLVSGTSLVPFQARPGILRDPAVAAAVAAKLEPTPLWVRLVEREHDMRLDLSRTEFVGGKALEVPATDPVVVELTVNDRSSILTFTERTMKSFPMDLEAEAELRTATGTLYRIGREWLWQEHTAVLVAGPARNLSPWLRTISRSTGELLAREGYLLITAGGAGVEQLVAEGFASVARQSARHRMRHYVGPKRKPAVTLGKVVRTRSDESWAENAVGRAKVVLIFEGGPRTYMLGKEALLSGKPVIPVGSTGAAERLRPEVWEIYYFIRPYARLTESDDEDIDRQLQELSNALSRAYTDEHWDPRYFTDEGEEYAR